MVIGGEGAEDVLRTGAGVATARGADAAGAGFAVACFWSVPAPEGPAAISQAAIAATPNDPRPIVLVSRQPRAKEHQRREGVNYATRSLGT